MLSDNPTVSARLEESRGVLAWLRVRLPRISYGHTPHEVRLKGAIMIILVEIRYHTHVPRAFDGALVNVWKFVLHEKACLIISDLCQVEEVELGSPPPATAHERAPSILLCRSLVTGPVCTSRLKFGGSSSWNATPASETRGHREWARSYDSHPR